MQRILILGAGFAGLWSAVGAARKRDELGIGPDRLELLVVNRTAWHSIRVRNYEAELDDTRVRLDQVLRPIGVSRIEAEVADIDVAARQVRCSSGGGTQTLTYDRLVFALGSRLVYPPIPGLAQYAFDVDTYEASDRLNAHIAALPTRPASAGRYTALVIGAGLTGIEVATEMGAKLRAAIAVAPGAGTASPRVILADHQPWIGSDMGDSARPVIMQALDALGVETRPGVSVVSVDAAGATLADGERIEAETIVWCAGMRAHPLTACFPVERDRLGRLPVRPTLKVAGMDAEFAAGDVAALSVDGIHPSVMSCQHARPMGRFAGHNLVCDLFGTPGLPLRIEHYVTVLDLGPWGAVYTEGWERRVVSQGAPAKRTKQNINRSRIYPPRSGDRAAILAAAAPVVQAPPQRGE